MAGAAVLTVVGFLGFRILDLEQRVATLSEQLGTPPGATEPAADGHPQAAAAAGMPKGFEQRLAALEKRVEGLSSAINTRRTQEAVTATSLTVPKEEAILSVVERENSRIREVQLEWHRSRWLESRQQALTVFASQQDLQPAQTSELNRALESEIDRMVELLKRPGISEDPDQVAADWQAALDATDQRAGRVLTSEQRQVWSQVRLFERRVLWPWLPPTQTAALP